ncbi:MAG: ATP-binding protein [Candidatus Berkiellales bacterium]
MSKLIIMCMIKNMDIRFQPNNTHLENATTFAKTDPHLKRLYAEKYIYHSPIIKELPRNEPGIITLGGGRQIGKTTMLKQWMESLLDGGVPPQAICFFSGELISDHQSLYYLIQQQLTQMPTKTLKYLILDEVTYIEQWDKTVKYLADIGALEEVVLMLSGSDLVLIQDARKRFPGRRGKASKVDFHYYPLSFSEFLKLKNMFPPDIEEINSLSEELAEMLYSEFDQYLIHGGFLSAINDFAKNKSISISTLTTYSDWIRGDILKRNKKEIFLQEIVGSIIKHYTKQISWNSLLKELSIDHTLTISDYISLLSAMDAVFVQSAIIEDKLTAAPKKQKKLMFCDPFIFHALSAWLNPVNDPYHEQIEPIFSDPQQYANLVESCVTTHFRRFFPTYYIKAEGEVDIAYVKNNRMWPVEVKWTTQLRSKDLKQILKYKNGKIFAKIKNFSSIDHIPIQPLPWALLMII